MHLTQIWRSLLARHMILSQGAWLHNEFCRVAKLRSFRPGSSSLHYIVLPPAFLCVRQDRCDDDDNGKISFDEFARGFVNEALGPQACATVLSKPLGSQLLDVVTQLNKAMQGTLAQLSRVFFPTIVVPPTGFVLNLCGQCGAAGF